MLVPTLLSLSALVRPALGFFIVGCGLLSLQRLDPIVSPNRLASHAHAILGGSNFDKTYNYQDSLNSDCTSCVISVDKSNYWAPHLYWYNVTGDKTYHSIPTSPRVYYIQRAGPKNEKIHAPPAGLVILAGNMMRRQNNKANFMDQAVSFVCQDFYNDHSGDPEWFERPDFFKHNCPNGMRAQMFFPSCWDGVNLDSPNHQDHMAYPIQNYNGGDCPATHPVHIISIFYEFIYAVDQFPFYPGVTNWVFSTGDTTGLSMHGDFQMGWDIPILQAAIDQCGLETGGDVSKCGPLLPYYDTAAAAACRPKRPIVDENYGVTDGLTSLPGCNPLWPNGTYYKPGCYPDPPTPGFFSPLPVLPKYWVDAGCYSEATSGRALVGARITGDQNMSVDQCASYCMAKGFLLAGLEYGQECYCGMNLLGGAAPLKSSRCNVACKGNMYQNCGGAGSLSLYKHSRLTYQDCTQNSATIGCVADTTTGARLLNGPSYVNNTAMTREMCSDFCRRSKQLYFGIEYSTQCYCGNSFTGFAGNSLPPLIDPSSCNMPCSGNPTQYCGGSRALNLYNVLNTTSICPVQSLADEDTTPTGPVPTATTVPESPDTGSSSLAGALGATFAVIAVAAAGGTVYLRRRKSDPRSAAVSAGPWTQSMMNLNSRSDANLSSSMSLTNLTRVRGPRDDPRPLSPTLE